MFKENKEFWLYIVGTIALMVLTYFVIVSYQFPFVGFLGNKQSEKNYDYDKAPSMSINTKKDYRAKIYTNKGLIEIDLYEKNAPVTVNNFVFLANEGYYDGVSFHRVIKDFLVQTGSRNTLNSNKKDDAMGDPGYYFDDEINWDSLGLTDSQKQALDADGFTSTAKVKSRRLEKYSVAMANAGPNTNGSQFFIVTADSSDSRLNVMQGRYTVFGTVVSGVNVLSTINNAELENAGDDSISRPIGDYYIESIQIVTL